MKKYYFTFGQNHVHENGTPMKDYWVEVEAKDYGEARGIFVREFSAVFMDAPDKWAFQYSESQIDKVYFPKGCYLKLKS